ncbi:MAG: hypothetical protein AAGC55_31180, partial [Myxococcota bacterium]
TIGASWMWAFFAPATACGVVANRSLARWADRGGYGPAGLSAYAALLLGLSGLLLEHPVLLGVGTTLFMSGYLGLLTVQPAHAMRLAGAHSRGQVMGIYNGLQFFGSFAGGLGAGLLWGIAPVLAIAGAGLAGLLGVVAHLASWRGGVPVNPARPAGTG